MTQNCFVFGSNEAGYHGAGAARDAYLHGGIKIGESYGHYGECFAIPTKDKSIQSMPLKRIEMYITGFKAYAEGHPEIIFKVTQIGCGLAGFTKEEIAPFFIGSPSNCLFDTAWMNILGRNYTYWGTG